MRNIERGGNITNQFPPPHHPPLLPLPQVSSHQPAPHLVLSLQAWSPQRQVQRVPPRLELLPLWGSQLQGLMLLLLLQELLLPLRLLLSSFSSSQTEMREVRRNIGNFKKLYNIRCTQLHFSCCLNLNFRTTDLQVIYRL